MQGIGKGVEVTYYEFALSSVAMMSSIALVNEHVTSHSRHKSEKIRY